MTDNPYSPPASTLPDPMSTESPPFLIAIHVMFAWAIVGAAYFALSQLTNAGDDSAFLLGISLGYTLKVIIVMLWRHRPFAATLAYAALAVTSITICYIATLPNLPPRSWTDLLICDPLILLTLPTITFIFDLHSARLRSIPFLTWRSMAEIFAGLPMMVFILDYTFRALGLRL